MDKNDDMIRQVFELGDVDVDQDALAQRIARNMEERPYHISQKWPEFAVTPPEAHETYTLPAELQMALRQAAAFYDQIWVAPILAPPRREIIAYIKHQFHQLVIFYTNKLGEKQINANEHLLRALNSLAVINHQQNQEIAVLQHQINQLQAKVARLEQS